MHTSLPRYVCKKKECFVVWRVSEKSQEGRFEVRKKRQAERLCVNLLGIRKISTELIVSV